MERIQKILAHGGIASRRAAEQLIKAGRVRVNGQVITELGAKADERRDRIEVDGKRVVAEQLMYIVLHKPRGVVATMSDPEGRPTVHELLKSLTARVYPVGRLDFATSGVLLATNDGELADGLLHPRKTVPKTYVLKVKGVMKPDDLDVWRKGVRLEDGVTLPADAKLLRHEADKTWIELTIREGRNQQIRRMGEATGFPVMRLARVGFAEITAEGLAPGRWRHMTRDELVALKKTYGVPRSIPSAPTKPANTAENRRALRTGPAARRGAVGRTQRAFGDEGTSGEPHERSARGAGASRTSGGSEGDRGRGRSAPAGEGRDSARGGASHASGGPGGDRGRGRGRSAPAGEGRESARGAGASHASGGPGGDRGRGRSAPAEQRSGGAPARGPARDRTRSGAPPAKGGRAEATGGRSGRGGSPVDSRPSRSTPASRDKGRRGR